MISVQLNTGSVWAVILIMIIGPVISCAICDILHPVLKYFSKKLWKLKKSKKGG